MQQHFLQQKFPRYWLTQLEQKHAKQSFQTAKLSLAIGNKGQNVRLAARLTGWKIDIGPESQAEQIIEEMETLRRETQEQIDKAVEDLFADEEF